MRFSELRNRVEFNRWCRQHPNVDWYNDRTGCGAPVMFAVLICLFIVCSCRPCKHIVSETKDSVRVEVRTNTVYVPDTVYVEIPAQSAEVTVKDSTSHLENDYAVSDARINPDGTLSHSLATKPQNISAEFEKPIDTNDSIVYRYLKKTEKKTETKYVEVEKKLYWWQTGLIWLGGTFLVFGVGWLVFKFRKKIKRLF